MPFTSLSQMQLCYKTKKWDCSKTLKETNSVCALNWRKTVPRKLKVQKKVVSPVIEGPRGGRYILISEKDRSGIICEIKVYVPRDTPVGKMYDTKKVAGTKTKKSPAKKKSPTKKKSPKKK